MNKTQGSYIAVFILVVALLGCDNEENRQFTMVSASDSGLQFNNILRDTTDQNILDYLYFYNGGGVAIGDINNDDLPDVFFTSNQNPNKLFLNKGNLKFEDISAKAGIEGGSTWNTGVSMADVNGDGLLDIYVCAVVGTNGFMGYNELFINNGDATFTERSAEYGLDFTNYSSKATFFDYDLDGDLDMYLLNHAIHTQDSYGKASIRNKRNAFSGDKLMRNDGNTFTDVSEEAGIYGGPNGYGLDVSVSDFNNDGYPDLYISNDFHEDDYYYLNNTDGTFTESLKSSFGHISKFSMGNDVADINNDGYTDIISLDMLPEDEVILKSSAGDDNIQLQKLRTETFGYNYQYSRNMLQINGSDHKFTETALLSGVGATDWSWSALIADYNNDGHQDVFISNGIPKRPNDLDYINYISDSQISKKLNTTNFIDKEALELMPEGKLQNTYWEGQAGIKFKANQKFANHAASFSTGAAFGDLDNDGDIDIVVNNINQEAFLYKNTAEKTNYCTVKLEYEDENLKGIGSKVIVYQKYQTFTRELFPQRGFQSSSDTRIHFGLGENSTIDSIQVIWPNRTIQTVPETTGNSFLTISYNESETRPFVSSKKRKKTLFVKKDNLFVPKIVHAENDYIDFNRHKLLHYKISDRGPALAIGDLDNDGLDDIYLGGSKRQEEQIYLQTDVGFIKWEDSLLVNRSIKETVSARIEDFDRTGIKQIVTGAGGGEFFGKSDALTNTLLSLVQGELLEKSLPDNFEDTSIVETADFDRDGDIDIFVGNATISNDFGTIPESYVLVNEGKHFSKIFLGQLGMVRDAEWAFIDDDLKLDLVVVGEWMQPTLLVQSNGNFKDMTSEYGIKNLNGLWRCVSSIDIDEDGDFDLVLGNWGENSKFKASQEEPMLMYYGDFDGNSKTETIIAAKNGDKYYPLDGLDRLSGQLSSFFKKKYNNYKSFAGQTIEEVLGTEAINQAELFKVHTLQSGYLSNEGDSFRFIPFDERLQVAPINTMIYLFTDNINGLLLAGNYKGVTPFHGRMDGFKGALVFKDDHIVSGEEIGLDFYNKVINQLGEITINNKQYLVAVEHNGEVQFYEIQ